MGESVWEEAAAHFGGGGGLGGRDGKMSADGVQVMGNEAGVCPHVSGGMPNGVSGRLW